MNILIKYKGIFIVAIISIGAFAGYHFFLGAGSSTGGSSYLTSTSNTGGGVSEAEILGAEISKAIKQVDELKLDKSIFSHPILNKLKDRDREITPQDVERKNPFAPLGVQSDSSDGVDLSGLIDSLE